MKIIEQNIAWCRANAGKTFYTSDGWSGRLIGFNRVNGRPLIEHKTGDILPGNDNCNFIVLYPTRSYSLDISELLLKDGKTDQQLKAEEIERLDKALVKLIAELATTYTDRPEATYVKESIERINERIEEIELSGHEPYIPGDI